jgi:hypothetical protein
MTIEEYQNLILHTEHCNQIMTQISQLQIDEELSWKEKDIQQTNAYVTEWLQENEEHIF